MKHALIIARREIIDRRMVLLTSVVLAIMPLIAAAVQRKANREEVISVLATFSCIAFAIGLSLALGASIVGRELSDRRLSFYFSKPVSPSAIWFGKVLAAMFMILTSIAVILTPGLLVVRKWWAKMWTFDAMTSLLGLVAISFSLFLIAHVISTMVRSRSALIGLDFAALLIAAYLMWRIVQPLILSMMAFEALTVAAAILGTIVFVTLAGAGAWQLSRGRTERVASHRALSQFLWSGVAVAIVCAGGYVWWLTHAEPSDLEGIYVRESVSGPWVAIAGPSPNRADYRPSFLFNVDSGTYERLGDQIEYHDLTFSRDGKTYVSARPVGFRRPRFNLLFRRLDGDRVTMVPSSIVVGLGANFALNDDGSRLAVLEDGVLSVHDVGGERVLASAKMEKFGHSPTRMFFVTPDLVRIYHYKRTSSQPNAVESRVLDIYELDIPRRSIHHAQAAPIQARMLMLHTSVDGARLLMRAIVPQDHGGGSVRVIDGRDGRELANVVPATGERVSSARLLSDGSFAVTFRAGDTMRLATYGPDGSPRSSQPFGKQAQLFLGNEIAPGKLIVTTRVKYRETAGTMSRKEIMKRQMSGWSSRVFDTHTGQITEALPVYPRVDAAFGWFMDPRIPPVSSRVLYFDQDGALGIWNAATGEKRVVLRPSA